MMHYIALYVTIVILVLFLGTKQEQNLDKACIAAMTLVGLFAALMVVLLHGTPYFPLGAFATAVLCLVHQETCCLIYLNKHFVQLRGCKR